MDDSGIFAGLDIGTSTVKVIIAEYINNQINIIGYGNAPSAGLSRGECIIGADSHTCSYGALGAFSTGVGTTDIATGMATGELWFKVPEAIKFVLTGKPTKYVSGKDIILHIINEIGVDGALYKSMEFVGDGIQYLTMDDIEKLETGVLIDGNYKTKPAKAKILKIDLEKNNSRIEIKISEGKNRQIRKMCAAINKKVIALHRSKIGNISVKDLKIGTWRYLGEDEINLLLKNR